jgi:GH15 family glucan-1,4-alpha-glucosidase
MTEQFDPRTDIALGNVPQGYSHAGLIHAWAAIHGSTALATPPG